MREDLLCRAEQLHELTLPELTALLADADPAAEAALAAAAGAPTLVLLAADGSLRYAGPLAPPALTCGRAAVPLATALPGLLSGRGPPLILPSRCSC